MLHLFFDRADIKKFTEFECSYIIVTPKSAIQEFPRNCFVIYYPMDTSIIHDTQI